MLKYFNRHCFVIAVFLVALLSAGIGSEANDIVTLTLPAPVIEQSIRSVLPLPIEVPDKHLQGELVLDSIDRLVLKKDGARVKGVVLGHNVVLVTRMGNQNIRMRVGTVRLPLTCDFSFRFDPKQNILFVKPVLEQPRPTNNPRADALLPFLVLLNNREYPISLDSIQTFQAQVGNHSIDVDLKPVDLRATPQKVTLRLRPAVRKTD